MATGFQGVQAPNTGSLPQPGQQPNPFPIPGENNASQSSGFQVAATQPQPNKAGSMLGSLVGPAQAGQSAVNGVENGIDSLLTPAAGAAGAGTGIEGLGTAATGLEGLGASTEGIAGLGSAVTDLGTGAAGTSGLMSLLATIFA